VHVAPKSCGPSHEAHYEDLAFALALAKAQLKPIAYAGPPSG